VKYLLIHSVDESAYANTEQCGVPDQLQAWIEEMTARGVVLDGARLRPVSDATSVRVRDGQVVTTDGPFAETKEQVAGYDVIDCEDLDTAVAVAAAHPTTRVGSIEVRAFDEGMPDPEVPDGPADGKLRYLMLVCADMRAAMRDAAENPEGFADDSWETNAGTSRDTTTSDIDIWVDQMSDRRLYGWPLTFPDQAVTVRRMDGEVVTTDGPFAETKEQIAGYDLLECDDLDQALEAAATHPVAAGGVIEVRPLWL
jgi:hypothetical protein